MNINLRNLEPETRAGYCRCGCGKLTKLNKDKGAPNQFLHGHHSRSRVKYKETATGCWEWQTGTAPTGYGVAWIEGRSVSAHKAVYESLVGPVPEGLVLDHICRNKICVNPSHLRVVTIAENTRCGKSAKLSVEDVLNIRELSEQGVTQDQIAKLYKVTQGAVSWVVRRGHWKDV